jgi:hypothetical protein
MTQDQIVQLKAAFPEEALSADTSRGFELTSIRAAYVIERLNDVFGICGMGWRYVHSSFDWFEGEIVTELALQYTTEGSAAGALMWDARHGGWTFLADSKGWSWPVFAVGGRKISKGGVPFTDTRKSAVTDGLTKAASMLGVGHEVFKGLVRVGNPPKPSPTEPTSRATETSTDSLPANAQAFWKLANRAIDAGISHERIRTLAASANGNGWAGAMDALRSEMAEAS